MNRQVAHRGILVRDFELWERRRLTVHDPISVQNETKFRRKRRQDKGLATTRGRGYFPVGDKNEAAGAADAASCDNEAVWIVKERNAGFVLQSSNSLLIRSLRLKIHSSLTASAANARGFLLISKSKAPRDQDRARRSYRREALPMLASDHSGAIVLQRIPPCVPFSLSHL